MKPCQMKLSSVIVFTSALSAPTYLNFRKSNLKKLQRLPRNSSKFAPPRHHGYNFIAIPMTRPEGVPYWLRNEYGLHKRLNDLRRAI